MNKPREEKKPEFHFFQISSEPDIAKVKELVNILAEGGKIVSAVGQAHSVQYIIKQESK